MLQSEFFKVSALCPLAASAHFKPSTRLTCAVLPAPSVIIQARIPLYSQKPNMPLLKAISCASTEYPRKASRRFALPIFHSKDDIITFGRVGLGSGGKYRLCGRCALAGRSLSIVENPQNSAQAFFASLNVARVASL